MHSRTENSIGLEVPHNKPCLLLRSFRDPFLHLANTNVTTITPNNSQSFNFACLGPSRLRSFDNVALLRSGYNQQMSLPLQRRKFNKCCVWPTWHCCNSPECKHWTMCPRFWTSGAVVLVSKKLPGEVWSLFQLRPTARISKRFHGYFTTFQPQRVAKLTFSSIKLSNFIRPCCRTKTFHTWMFHRVRHSMSVSQT